MPVDVSSLRQHRLRHPLIIFYPVDAVLALADTLGDNGCIYPTVDSVHIYQVKLIFLFFIFLATRYRLSQTDLGTLILTFNFKYFFVLAAVLILV